MVPTIEDSKVLPITSEEIVTDVGQCIALGASMVHLHARDESGVPTWRKEIFGETIGLVRSNHPEVVLIVSTSGRLGWSLEQRMDVLALADGLKPDMASLNLGPVMFLKHSNVDSLALIEEMAVRMGCRGIKPELEVFDFGAVNVAHHLIRRGLICPPHYFNLILGNLAGAQAKIGQLAGIISELPPDFDHRRNETCPRFDFLRMIGLNRWLGLQLRDIARKRMLLPTSKSKNKKVCIIDNGISSTASLKVPSRQGQSNHNGWTKYFEWIRTVQETRLLSLLLARSRAMRGQDYSTGQKASTFV